MVAICTWASVWEGIVSASGKRIKNQAIAKTSACLRAELSTPLFVAGLSTTNPINIFLLLD